MTCHYYILHYTLQVASADVIQVLGVSDGTVYPTDLHLGNVLQKCWR